MTTLHEAAQQALWALQYHVEMTWPVDRTNEAIFNLRAALAEPVQEPVLVVEKEPDYWSRGHFHEGSRSHIDHTKVWSLPIGTKLYTTPPQRKPLSLADLQEALVLTNLIDRDAIEDPDEYDHGSTLAQIGELHRIIT